MSTQVTYRSIAGEPQLPYIDCDRCIQAIYSRIRQHVEQDDGSCPLCNYFREKIGNRDGSEPDARLLLHAQINVVFELFARHDDQEMLFMLQGVEDDCC